MSLAKALSYTFLTLASAFGVIGSSVGLNALIKSNIRKSELKASVPAGMSISINTNDVLRTGIITAAACATIGLVAAFSLKTMLVPSWKSLGARTQRLRGWLLAFLSLWLMVNHILFTIFFATREGKIRLWKGDVELPQSAVHAAEAARGTTSVYSQLYILKLLCVFPWITFFFGSMASVILLVAPPEHSINDSYDMTPTTVERGFGSRAVHNPVAEKVRFDRAARHSVASLDDTKTPL